MLIIPRGAHSPCQCLCCSYFILSIDLHMLLGCVISTDPHWLLSWFNPSQQLGPTQPLTHTPSHPTPGGVGKKIRRVKVRNLVAWDKDSLIGKAKAVHASKAKRGIHSPLPISPHLQESSAPAHIM